MMKSEGLLKICDGNMYELFYCPVAQGRGFHFIVAYRHIIKDSMPVHTIILQ